MKLKGNDQPTYFTRTDEREGGPYSLEALESLVYLGRITPDTLIRSGTSGEFVAIRVSELALVLFPRLDDKTGPKDWGAPGKPDSHLRSSGHRYELTEAKFEKVTPPENTERIDVHDILQQIRQKEIDVGYDRAPKRRFRISKRSIDFWLMLVLGNILFLAVGLALKNTASITFAIAGCGLYTFGLLWSMYGVMDRY